MPLSYKTHRATVTTSIQEVINLALRVRLPAVATVAALRAVATRGPSGTPATQDLTIRYVTGASACYVYRSASSLADDGSSVVKPADAGAQPGRWLLATQALLNEDGVAISAQQTGYLNAVLIYQGERTKQEWDSRILALRPAVMIQYTGETKEQISGLRGAQAIKWLHFTLYGVSFNGRIGGTAAQFGSPVAAERARDPGVDKIMGDLEYLLDGLQGSEISVDGIDFMRFGEVSPAIENLSSSEFVWTAPLDVRVNVGKEDAVREPLDSAYFQAEDVQNRPFDGTEFDPDNYIAAVPTGTGFEVALGMGFSRACADGQAYIAGELVTVTGSPSHDYTPSAATWRDLNPDGTFTYVETASVDVVPPVTTGALRLAVTIADPSGIIEDRMLAPSSALAGPQNQVL